MTITQMVMIFTNMNPSEWCTNTKVVMNTFPRNLVIATSFEKYSLFFALTKLVMNKTAIGIVITKAEVVPIIVS